MSLQGCPLSESGGRKSMLPSARSAFLETIIAFLLPYFSAASRDKHEARSEILDTLACLRNPHQSGNAAGRSHHRLRHDHPRCPRRGQNRRDVTIHAPPLPKLRQQPQSLHPPDRKGARPASRRRNPRRPRRNAGAHRRHAGGRNNGRHSAIQSVFRMAALGRQAQTAEAFRFGPECGSTILEEA